MSEASDLDLATSERAADEVAVVDENGELRVALPEHGAVVDVCRSDERASVVDDHHLTVYVHQLGHLSNNDVTQTGFKLSKHLFKLYLDTHE